MYRLIPFKKLSDVCDCSCSITDLYAKCLRSSNILIQDTEDMVVENFTLKQLHDLQLKYGVNFDVFSCYYNFMIRENYEVLSFCKYLDKDLMVRVTEDFNFPAVLVDLLEDEIDYSDQSIIIKHRGIELVIKFLLCCWEEEDKVSALLCINELPIAKLNNSIISNSSGEYYISVSLVQVCKTNKGFELVLLFDEKRLYFGVSLTDTLDIVKFVNIEKITKDNKSIDCSSLKSDLAKRKLTGKWSDFVCTD